MNLYLNRCQLCKLSPIAELSPFGRVSSQRKIGPNREHSSTWVTVRQSTVYLVLRGGDFCIKLLQSFHKENQSLCAGHISVRKVYKKNLSCTLFSSGGVQTCFTVPAAEAHLKCITACCIITCLSLFLSLLHKYTQHSAQLVLTFLGLLSGTVCFHGRHWFYLHLTVKGQW